MPDYSGVVKGKWSQYCKDNFTSGQWPIERPVVALVVDDVKTPTLEFFLGETDAIRVQGSTSWTKLEAALSPKGAVTCEELRYLPSLSVLSSDNAVALGSPKGISSAVVGDAQPCLEEFLSWKADGQVAVNFVPDAFGVIARSKYGEVYATRYAERSIGFGGSLQYAADNSINFNVASFVFDYDDTPHTVSRISALVRILRQAGQDPEVFLSEDRSEANEKAMVKFGYTVFHHHCRASGNNFDVTTSIKPAGGIASAVMIRIKTGWNKTPYVKLYTDDFHNETITVKTWSDLGLDPSTYEGYEPPSVLTEPALVFPRITNGLDKLSSQPPPSQLLAGWTALAPLTPGTAKDEWAMLVGKANFGKGVSINTVDVDGVTMHIVVVRPEARYYNFPLTWFQAKVTEGREKGRITEAEADELEATLRGKTGLSLRVVAYSQGVRIPRDLVLATDLHRKYAKTKKKACKDDDFLDQVFCDGQTYGALNAKLNGMPTIKWFYSLSDPTLASTLEWAADPAPTQTISYIDTHDKSLGLQLCDRGTGAVISTHQKGENDLIMLHARGAQLNGVSLTELKAFCSISDSQYDGLLSEKEEVSGYSQQSVRVGGGLVGNSAFMRFDTMGTAIEGYPDAKNLQISDWQMFARCVMTSVASVPFGMDAVKSALQEISL